MTLVLEQLDYPKVTQPDLNPQIVIGLEGIRKHSNTGTGEETPKGFTSWARNPAAAFGVIFGSKLQAVTSPQADENMSHPFKRFGEDLVRFLEEGLAKQRIFAQMVTYEPGS